jgi:glycerate 2-kinase
MKIIVAPDSFKGSLSALRICQLVAKAAAEVCPDAIVHSLPLADGGEGTADALLHALNGTERTCTVHAPLGNEIPATYGIFREPSGTPATENNRVLENSTTDTENRIAIMDMASASGLTLVSDEQRDVLASSTYGTGEMILDAINQSCRKIYIGLGGSATNDGGMGMAAALGVRFLDCDGNLLPPVPNSMTKVDTIDLADLDPRISDITITIMSDVKNPLLGETGATYIYGPQKGVTDEQLPIVDAWMAHYIQKAEEATGKSVRDIEGAGAAGGLGAGLLAFTPAKIQSGIETILDLLHFDELLEDADFVITGEGRMDYQSAFGKVVSGVGTHCRAKKVPCYALVGSIGPGAEQLFEHGITSILPTVDHIMPLSEAMANADELCYSAAVRMLRFVHHPY